MRWLLYISVLLLCALPACAATGNATSNENATVDNNVICNVPTGVVANTIVLIAASQDTGTSTNWVVQLPAGFTAFGTQFTQTLPDGQTGVIAWHRASGSESGTYAFGALNSAGGAAWLCTAIAFSGRDTTNPPVAGTATTNTTANPSAVNVAALTVTAVAGDDLVWVSMPDVNASGIGNGHTPPASYTERIDVESTLIVNNLWQNISIASQDNVGAGATGTITGTFALTSGGAGFDSLLIRIPVAAAGGTCQSRALLGVGC